MKLIFLIALLLGYNSPHSNKQITIQDLIKMASYNTDAFETHVLQNGFEYDTTVNYSEFDVLYYKKDGRFISKSMGKSKEIKNVFYETFSKEEYASLKNGATAAGFKFVKSEKHEIDNDNTVYHVYRKSNSEIQFYTANRKRYLGYCIAVDIK